MMMTTKQDTLIERLQIKADVMEMGERITWGSDTALMREAADALALRDAQLEAVGAGGVSALMPGSRTRRHAGQEPVGELSDQQLDALLVEHGKGDDGFHGFARAVIAAHEALQLTGDPLMPVIGSYEKPLVRQADAYALLDAKCAEIERLKSHLIDAQALIQKMMVEKAALRQDAVRLDFVLSFATGEESSTADKHALLMAHALSDGIDGRAAVDAAMAQAVRS